MAGEDKEPKKAKRDFATRIVEDTAWVLPALVIAYFADLPKAVRENAYGWSLYLTILSLLGFAGVYVNLTIWIPYTTGVTLKLDSWEKDFPRHLLSTFHLHIHL